MARVPTIQAITDRAGRQNDLVGPGEILDMKLDTRNKGLSLRAAKLLHLLIKEAGAKAADDVEHKVAVATLNQTMHLTLNDFIATVEELMDVRLRLRVPDGEGGQPEIWLDRLIQSVKRTEIDNAQAVVRFKLSDSLRKILENSVHWAVLSRKALLAFESRYALRLYELVSLRIGLTRNTENFTIEDLRERLGVPHGKLMKWDAFNRKALSPAIAEVNHLSGFVVSCTPYKSGRSVAGVTMQWALAPTTERVKVQRELEASRVGRGIRRTRKEEKVVDLLPVLAPEATIFPREGGIAYSSWADAARSALPYPRPDIDHVADRFRDFCGRKGILLNHPKIAETFVGFCRNWKMED
ncbi:MAG TPA: replication initiation protein [Methylomirabilota bacterium]|nr:replication initiation protein [Methylomirabilota bacterium]